MAPRPLLLLALALGSLCTLASPQEPPHTPAGRPTAAPDPLALALGPRLDLATRLARVSADGGTPRLALVLQGGRATALHTSGQLAPGADPVPFQATSPLTLPAGAHRLAASAGAAVDPLRAAGLRASARVLRPAPAVRAPALLDLRTTALDLVRLETWRVAALDSEDPQARAAAQGLALGEPSTWRGLSLVNQAGLGPGGCARVLRAPDHDLGLVLWSADPADHAQLEALALELLEVLLAQHLERPTKDSR